MRKKFLLLISSLLCLATTHFSYAALYTPLTPNQMDSFNHAILNEVQKADATSADAMSTLIATPSMSVSAVEALNVIVNMDKIKHNLADSLLNTPSMNSPLVRDRFLSIMQQDIINNQDLVGLQILINSENAAMAAAATAPEAPAAPATPAAPTGTASTSTTTAPPTSSGP